MCGIAGILRVWPGGKSPPGHEHAIPEPWLDTLDAHIKHRGPDGQGRFRDRALRPGGITVDVALVHRRLSIVDHTGGAQPMLLRGGRSHQNETYARLFQGGPNDSVRYQPQSAAPGVRACVVFNGCVYNHRELRAELASRGRDFTTDHSDTECLLHAWCEWGEAMFDRLDAMHAFALWDAADARLILARDLFGEKPLYVLALPERHAWAFASTAAALVALCAMMGEPVVFDKAACVEWITRGYSDRATPYAAITQAPPGEIRPIEAMGGLHATPRLDRVVNPPERSARFVNKKLLLDGWEARLRASVMPRLDADVPLACLLSGGVDSSVVAWAASTQRPDLTCVTVRMPVAGYDETSYAADVARAINARHVVVDAGAEPMRDLDRLIGQLGMPFGDSSLLPTFWACDAAASVGKVLLTGDGGDEMFLGYDRYDAARWVGLLTPFLRLIGTDQLIPPGPDPRSTRSRVHRLFDALVNEGYVDFLAIYPASLRCRFFSDDSHASRSIIRDRLDARAYDVRFHLPGDMLRKVDAASMSAGVEVRAPLLAHPLATAALSLHERVARLGRQRKGLLRALARRHLPHSAIDRRKMGFAIPLGDWLRSDHAGLGTRVRDIAASGRLLPSGVDLPVNFGFIQTMVDEHMESRRDHSQRLYMLLALDAWTRWHESAAHV